MGTDLYDINDPLAHIQIWLDQASETELNDPNAMSLATAGQDMLPDVRIVLLKGITPKGLYFYTNQQSTKAQEIEENKQVAICLHWKSVRRQIRARGPVTQASVEESDAYFATRSRKSQIGAWASQQSSPLESREVFLDKIDEVTKKYEDAEHIPRPPHWGGYILSPLSIEFWEEKEFRLHTRRVFTRTSEDNSWDSQLLYP